MKAVIFTLTAFGLFFSGIRTKPFIPPGTVKLSETLYADKTEITNLAWIEYVVWTAGFYGKGSPQHLATLPDTLVWRNAGNYNEPYTSYYHKHLAYKDYPAVGISHEQAVAYCKWRTRMVKQQYKIRYHQELNIDYRLPTQQEWEDLNPHLLYRSTENNTCVKRYNLHHPVCDTTNKFADILKPAVSFQANELGIYNTIGNVAEMLQEKGVCKGGSWRHTLPESLPGKTISYSKPEAWLGFRCVCDYTIAGR